MPLTLILVSTMNKKPSTPDNPTRQASASKLTQVRAVSRAIAVLQSFEQARTRSLAEITKATGLDKGTVRRLLHTLLAEDFVAYDESTQRYGLGVQLRRLAAGSLDSLDLRSLAVPSLYALAEQLSVTAYLAVYRDGCAICLERIHDTNGFAVRNWKVGGTMPLNCGGAAKLLTAYQPKEEMQRAINTPLVAMTPNTITSRSELLKRLVQIRKRGWELAVDDVVLGLSTLAVPILASDGTIICAVSIAGLTPQLVQRGKPLHLQRLQDIAENIASRITAQTESTAQTSRSARLAQ